MLEQEKYERIQEEDIKDQLELFTYNYIDTINLEEIKRMEDCGMVINLVKKTNDKIQNDKAIIKKLKL